METEIKIVYKDADILVVSKPAGWVTTVENYPPRRAGKLPATAGRQITHHGGQANHKYLEEWVKEHFPNDLERGGIVHRLDKNTSGLVVVAKNQTALLLLKKQFKARVVTKKYVALVGGDFPSQAEIQMPIGRVRYAFERFAVHEEGKMAWTVVARLKKLKREGKSYSLLEVGLKTGRTHQIRVHLSYLRYPIVGDRLYGGEMRIDRQFLHATYLKFTQPLTGKAIELKLELPDELVEELAKYEEV